MTQDDLHAAKKIADGIDVDRKYFPAIKTIRALRAARLNDEAILSAHEKYDAIVPIMTAQRKGTHPDPMPMAEAVEQYLRKYGEGVALYKRIQRHGDPSARVDADIRSRANLNGVKDTVLKITKIKEEQTLYAIAALLPTF